jgi:transcriptional regulator with XRE-family HTH domain
MKRRVEFDGTHQARALRGLLSWSQRALRTKSGKTLKDLAGELSMSPATLARYLNGTQPLGSEHFARFAEAFETSEAELIAACFPALDAQVAPPPPPADRPWTIRDALRGHIPEHLIDEIAEERGNDPLADQMAAVIDILRVYHEVQAEASVEMLERLRRRDRPA